MTKIGTLIIFKLVYVGLAKKFRTEILPTSKLETIGLGHVGLNIIKKDFLTQYLTENLNEKTDLVFRAFW